MTRLAGLILLAGFFLLPDGRSEEQEPGGPPGDARIPRISGEVLDALTGRPIAGIDVTLRVAFRETPGTLMPEAEPHRRYENSRTSPHGRFEFNAAVVSGAGHFTPIYWLSANRTFWSPAWMKKAFGRDLDSDPYTDDVSYDVIQDPLFIIKFNAAYLRAGPRVNNRAYFPMAAWFGEPCSQTWNANCLQFPFTENVRIPLIPVLDNPDDCRRIADYALAEQCRQLNAYRSAFRRVETIAEVRADRELCREVDHGPGSEACLKFLPVYIGNRLGYDRPPVRMREEIDPIEKVVILKPVAGMSVERWGVGELNPYRETVPYAVSYSAVKGPTSADVSVIQLGPEDTAQGYLTYITRIPGSVEHTESVEGNVIVTVDSSWYYRVAWISGNRVVSIDFTHLALSPGMDPALARTAEASPEMRHELIRQYLLKYPSSR